VEEAPAGIVRHGRGGAPAGTVGMPPCGIVSGGEEPSSSTVGVAPSSILAEFFGGGEA